MTVVLKSDGSQETFDSSKLQRSLHRAGAAPDMADSITREVTEELFDGISTSEIYAKAFTHLREHRQGVAARYSLKRAVLEFGPSGFPFEAYIGELFKAEGYTTAIDQIIQGACVEHEVDVVASKGSMVTYVEAKFHNTAAFKTDLKTVLYVKARMDDIKEAKHPDKTSIGGLVVTNTKFTTMAIQYATCQKLDLLGWEYPHQGNLHDRIDAAKLYPVTALMSLSKREKMALLGEKKVLCTSLAQDTEALLRAGVRANTVDAVLEEIGALCVPGKDI